MLQQLKNKIRGHAVNAKGWRTRRRIVVIESDDWGAVRLPSVKLLEKLEDWKIETRKDPMLRNDSLASEEDLKKFFETLQGIPGKEKPVMTANTIVANPDFNKIESDNFESFHYQPFIETFQHYPSHQRSFDLWKKGMDEGLFHPQFHGREHLHVHRWMNGLQNRASETARLFDERLYAVCGSASTEHRQSYLAAYEWDTNEDRTFTKDSIREGLDLFETIFGFRSKSAIAPNYTWHPELEKVYADGGVNYLQGGTVQRSPDIDAGRNTPIRHFTGEENDIGLRYLVRNCRFEPTLDPGVDSVGQCLNQIRTAFIWRKPAIIESHRVNYIGYINPQNRDENLKLLDTLLRKIVRTWPDVEFMTSEKLGELMDEGN